MERPIYTYCAQLKTPNSGATVVLSALVALWTWLAVPARAFACSVCFDPDSAARAAYLGTTVVLSLLPLLLVVGLVAWLLQVNSPDRPDPRSPESSQRSGR